MRPFATRFIAFALTALLSATLSTQAYAADASSLLPPSERLIENIAQHPAEQNNPWKRRWAVSLSPLVASQALDAASSYGMRELNPLLANSNGSFGSKAAGIKFSAIGGLVAVEYLLVKKYPKSAKAFSILNWTSTAITTGLTVHNYNLR
jgi:hypothetical protein